MDPNPTQLPHKENVNLETDMQRENDVKTQRDTQSTSRGVPEANRSQGRGQARFSLPALGGTAPDTAILDF